MRHLSVWSGKPAAYVCVCRKAGDETYGPPAYRGRCVMHSETRQAHRRAHSALSRPRARLCSTLGHRGAGDREQLLELADGALTRLVEVCEVGSLPGAELGLLTAQPFAHCS